MILQFLIFITTILVVRSDSIRTRITSKPNLQDELHGSLYINDYIPEYILPNDELTESEKKDGDYLGFPDLKNEENDVFVPPESEYSKNNVHYKNIKGHKRLAPEKFGNYKMPNEDLKSDLRAHLTENFTGKDLKQNNSGKTLDFLLPISERTTNAALITPPLIHHIPQMGSTVYEYNNISTAAGSLNNLELMTTTKNPSFFPQPQFFFTIKPLQQTSNNIMNLTFPLITLHPNPLSVKPTDAFLMEQLPPFLNEKQTLHQILSNENQSQPQPLLNEKQTQPQTLLNKKQTLHQPLLNEKQTQPYWKENQLHSLQVGQQHEPNFHLLKMDKALESTFQNSGEEQVDDLLSKRHYSKAVNNRIEATPETLMRNVLNITNEKYKDIKEVTEPNNVPIYNKTTQNVENKVVGQTNISFNSPDKENHVVQVLENTQQMTANADQSTPKMKLFNFLNIFKKNKNKQQAEQTSNSSIEGKRLNGASSLEELYNRLNDSSNTINENNGMEKQYLIEQEANDESISYK